MLHKRISSVTGVAAWMVVAASLAACDITVGAARFSTKEQKTYKVTGAPQVDLATFDGSIEVRGWDRSEVLVEIEKHGVDQAAVDQIHVKATQSGNTIAIDIAKPSTTNHIMFGQSSSASLIVSVPMQTALKLESGDGSVSVKRVTGKVTIRTEDGSVRIAETKGELFVRTGDGSIEASEIDGQADIETHDGSIIIDGVLRAVRADSGDGSIRLTARKGSTMNADWMATTGDGSITVRVAEGFGATVDAESGDGGVQVDGVASPSSDREDGERQKSQRVSGSIGSGGKTLKLRSGSGSITVKGW